MVGGEATTANRSAIDAKQMSRIADSESTHGNLNSSNGMLAHYDKAVVHLKLVLFGYKYGAPSHARNGFTYTHPLPPLDVRDLD